MDPKDSAPDFDDDGFCFGGGIIAIRRAREQGEIQAALCKPISSESWLNRPEHAWFKEAYEYACTQTKAFPVLSQVEPEDLYYAICAVTRGAGIQFSPPVKKEST